MKSTFKKGLALGIGLALTSKEQAEKIIDELVEKGEVSKQESKEFFNELIQKGKETQKELDHKLNEKLNHLLGELDVATKEEVQELKDRITELEQQLKQNQ